MYVPIITHNVHLATSATSTPCQHPVECLETKLKLALARRLVALGSLVSLCLALLSLVSHACSICFCPALRPNI